MDDFEIGYGKPPRHTQFKPGQSGNTKGRPKGARGLKTDLREELSERVSITENGKTRKISKQQLLIKSLVAQAAKGNVRAADKILSLLMQIFGVEDERTGKTKLSLHDQALLDGLLGDVRSDDEAPAPDASSNGAGDGNNHGGNVTLPDEEDMPDDE